MQSENHYTETDLGNVAPNPRGNFDSTAKYEYLDLVAMQGGSYLCLAELGQTITGIAPEAGKNTEHWQCVAIPGNMTPEYTDAYGKVVRLAREVEQDAAKVAEDKQSVTQMETNARQLKEQAEESARQAENSKDSAAGSAREAKKAEESARQAENNVRTQVNGFDAHVAEKTTEATQAVATAKDNAVQAVERQETASVQEVKDQTATYITEQKNLAKQELDDKVNQFGLDVNVIKAEVSKEGQKQITNVQEATTTELTKIAEKGTEQTGLVTAEGNKQVQAVQAAAQEIIADREQIQKNKADIASLTQNKADAIINTATGEHIAVGDSSGHLLDNLRIFGKSEQVQTTGKNLFSVVFNHTTDTGAFRYDMKLKPNTNYTLSCDVPKATVASLYLNGERTDINGVFKNGPKTIMTDETGNIYILVRNADYTNSINLYQAVLDGLHYIQLEEGENATSPEPYTGGKPSPSPDYPQEIVSAGDNGKIEIEIDGKQLFDASKILTKSVGGATVTNNGDGSFTISGSGNLLSELLITHTYTPEETRKMLKPGNIKLICDVTYPYMYMRCDTLSGHLFELNNSSDSNREFNLSNEMLNNKLSISIGFFGKEGATIKPGTVKPMLYQDGDGTWEPFQPLQSLSVTTTNSLPGIPVKSGGNYTDQNGQQWICDEIDFKRGKYIKRVEKKVLQQDSGWCLSNKAKYQAFGMTVSKDGAIGMCDKFQQVNGNGNYIGIDTKTKDRIYLVTGHETLEELKTWLTSNPLTVIYKLSTPIETDIPQETLIAYKKLHSNYPSTVIQNTEGAGMELSYVADTKNYTDNKIKEAVSAQTQSLANLLSLMPLSTQAAMIETDTNNILDNMEVTEYE